MSDIITKTYEFLDTLDKSNIIKNLELYKNKLLKNACVLSQISESKHLDNIKLIELKKELYNNSDYKHYMDAYNELYYIILKINKKYHEYTNTKGEDNE